MYKEIINQTSETMICFRFSFDMIVEKSPEEEQRKEVWNELRAHLKKIEKPRNILLLGSYGTGKSSFINTVTTALTGRYQFYADIGCGDKHSSTTLHK